MDIDFVNNPHDKFLKQTLSQKENAISFLKNYLPEDVKEVIDTENIEIQKDSYITDELEEYFSDLLYKVDINNREGYVYVLFEHKSYPDGDIGLQLLEYLLKIWKAKRKQNQKLPVVLPIVIYHGEKEWKVSSHFSELIDYEDERLKIYIPDFKYILYDISQYSDEEIIGTKELKYRLEILKNIRDKNFLEKFAKILDIIAEEFDIEDLKPILLYVYNIRDDDWGRFSEKIKEISTSGGDIIMTIAEQLKKDGKKQEQIEIARNLLDILNDKEIANRTGLDIEKVKEIRENNKE